MKIPWDYWAEDTSPPGGMYGGGGTLPRATVSLDADLERHPASGEEVPLELHPACTASAGPDYRHGYAEASLSQHLIFEHDAPSDWFWVDRVWVSLSAFGSMCTYSGHPVAFPSQLLATRAEIECGFTASIRQAGWDTGVVFVDETIMHSRLPPHMWWQAGEINAAAPIIFDDVFRTSPSSTLLLQGADSGGGPVQVSLNVWCRAYASTRDAFASISFAAPEGGIKIREMTLIPHSADP